MAPESGESVPLNAPALPIWAPGGMIATNVALTGANGLFVFVTTPGNDPNFHGTQLVTPIGAQTGVHDLSFVGGCGDEEHHAITFGPEVPYPTTIGRVDGMNEVARRANLLFSLSSEAAAYAPVARFGLDVAGVSLIPAGWYGEHLPYFSRSDRSLTVTLPADMLDTWCRNGAALPSLAITLQMHVAGMNSDPTPLRGTLTHSCLIDDNGDYGGPDGGSPAPPCSWTEGKSCGGEDPVAGEPFDPEIEVVKTNGCACRAAGPRGVGGSRLALGAAALFGAAFFRRMKSGRR